MEFQKGFWQFGFFFILILLLGIVGVGAYLYGRGDLTLKLTSLKPNLETTDYKKVALVPTPSPEAKNGEEEIISAVYAKTGLDKETAEVVISINTGSYAKGTIKEIGEQDGAYWIAAKSNNLWEIPYDGQTIPSCKQIATYNFPTSMVPECLDPIDQIVTR